MIWMKMEPTNNTITTAKMIFNKDYHQAATFSPTCSNHSSTEVTAYIYVKIVTRIHEIVRNL